MRAAFGLFGASKRLEFSLHSMRLEAEFKLLGYGRQIIWLQGENYLRNAYGLSERHLRGVGISPTR